MCFATLYRGGRECSGLVRNLSGQPGAGRTLCQRTPLACHSGLLATPSCRLAEV